MSMGGEKNMDDETKIIAVEHLEMSIEDAICCLKYKVKNELAFNGDIDEMRLLLKDLQSINNRYGN